MKKNFKVFLLLMLTQSLLLAQSPNLINYQGVARTDAGPIHGDIELRISVLSSMEGPAIYAETHLVQTTSGGLFTILIGNGTSTLGTFNSIDWTVGEKYLQVEMNLEGGGDFELMGVSQLVSVPYALFANEVANADDADADPSNEIELPEQTTGDAGLVLTADGVGGVSYAAANASDADSDPTNEIQDITTDNTPGNISLSDGSTLDLNVDDGDADATNELQELVLDGTMLSISDGTVQIDIANGTNTDNQNLSFDGANLSITGGNSIDISALEDDADADPTNELLQGGLLDGSTLELTDAGGLISIGLSSLIDDADADPTNELQNASEVSYDNANSGITSSNTQAAIDEIVEILNAPVVTPIPSADGVSYDNSTSGLPAGDVQTAIDALNQVLDENDSWLIGGNSTTGLESFGTTTNTDLSLITNNVEAIRLAANGSVGIGVANPLHPLQIQGETNNSNVLDPLSTITGEPYETGLYGNFTASNDSGTDNIGAAFQIQGSGRNFGILGLAIDNSATHNYSILAQAANGSGDNVGINADAESSTGNNYGAIVRADGATSGYNYGLWANAGNSTTNNIAIYADAEGDGTSQTTGVEAHAAGANSNRGLYGTSIGVADFNYGVYGNSADSGNENFGVYGEAMGNGTLNRGVRGEASGGTANNGLSGSATGAANWNYGVYGTAENSGNTNFGVYGEASGTGTLNRGVRGEATDGTINNGLSGTASGAADFNYGVYAESTDANQNYGIYASATGSGNDNYGVYGYANDASVQSMALYGHAEGSTGNNYGIRTYASGSTTATNYGVFAHAENGAINYAGYFEGDVTVTGALELGPLNFPTLDGSANQVLMTDGNGNLSWTDQSADGGVWTLAGNATGADATFGTTDNFDIAFITNNMELMRLDSDGDVGIGVSNPEHALHVYGGASDVAILSNITGSGNNEFVAGISSTATGNSAGFFRYHGGHFESTATGGNNYGIAAMATGAGINNTGIETEATGASNSNTGVEATASGAATNGNDGGVYLAENSGSTNRGLVSTGQGTASINRGLDAEASGASGTNEGVRAVANGTNSLANYGVNGYASGSGSNYGVRGQASNGSSNSYGVSGDASSTTGNNYGIRGTATSATTGTNYGVYGEAFGGGTNWAGWFGGNVRVTGTFDNSSDRRLKSKISTLTHALSNLSNIRGTTYYWKDKSKSQNLQYGVIAQEIEKVFPELVKEDEKGMKGVNYLGLIPVLIEAIKEQQNQISFLEKELAKNVASDGETSRKGLKSLQVRLEKIERILGAQANKE